MKQRDSLLEKILNTNSKSLKVEVSEVPPFISNYVKDLYVMYNLSRHTIIDYFSLITIFTKKMFLTFYNKPYYNITTEKYDPHYLSIDEKFYEQVEKRHVNDFLAELKLERNLKESSVITKIRQLKSFYSYLEEHYDIKNNVKNIRIPKAEKNLPVYLTLEEAVSLVNVVDKDIEQHKSSKLEWVCTRNKCMIVMLLNCALRRSELRSINIEDIKEDYIIVMGKGAKERTIYLNDLTKQSINDYLRVRPKDAKDNEALFITKNKHTYSRISCERIGDVVKKYLRKANLNDQLFSTHKLRHTSATLMYQHGNVDLRSLQQILGHASSKTTEIYTHVYDKNLKKAVNTNPLNVLYEENKKGL
ncbi:MAG: tyrosine-type recombinase/integrase [Finegoldia magna]